MSEHVSASALTETLMAVADKYSQLADLAASIRCDLEFKGFSPTAAEMMAANVYTTMVSQINQRAAEMKR